MPTCYFKPTLIHISSLNNDIIKYCKTSKRPLLCWVTPEDSLSSSLRGSLSQIDLIVSFGITSLDSAKKVVCTQKVEDLYHLVRIFAASRIASQKADEMELLADF